MRDDSASDASRAPEKKSDGVGLYASRDSRTAMDEYVM